MTSFGKSDTKKAKELDNKDEKLEKEIKKKINELLSFLGKKKRF